MVNNYIVYGDVEYTSGSFTVADGEIIRVYWSNRETTTNGLVKLNGTIVDSGVSSKTGYYSYTVSSNCTINGIYRLQWDGKRLWFKLYHYNLKRSKNAKHKLC